MSQFLRLWNTVTKRNEAVRNLLGLEVVARELRSKADQQNITVDSVSGITLVPGGVKDQFLAQITSANKVAGSAVQLASDGGVINDSGLKLDINAQEFEIDATSGLQLVAVPTSKLGNDVVLTDGSRAFTSPQGGVDAVANSDLTTLGQVDTLIDNAISGDFSETLLNLSGQQVQKGQVGFLDSTSGAFQLARANDPDTAIIQYACVASSPINDGASGSFQNPSVEMEGVEQFVSGLSFGDFYLSTSEWGLFQQDPPSTSGNTVLRAGWKIKDDKMVIFPGEPLDL